MSIVSVLVIAAFILFLLSALNVPSSKVNLTAAGLACLTLALLLHLWPLK